MIIAEEIAEDLKRIHQRLSQEGKLLSNERLKECYTTFRERFGPEVLSNLEGEKLLNTIHDNSNKNSMVYWLEFKKDEEFPPIFGSISGGSAFKFGVFRSSKTGAWMTGSSSQQAEITIKEAIKIAEKHRDQLIKGSLELDKLPVNGSDADYRSLQKRLEKTSKDVFNSVWGHKYFSLLHPDKLDDYHNPEYQRFHLLKLLQLPPSEDGRYVCGGRYLTIANEVAMPVNHLTTITNHRHGGPHRYWRIGTSDGNEPRSRWDLMKDNNCIAIGWEDLGDLSGMEQGSATNEKIKNLLKKHYENTNQVIGRWTQQISKFVTERKEYSGSNLNMKIGDLVFACDGSSVLGIGKIASEYFFEPSPVFPHRRSVKWLNLDEWDLPEPEGLRTTVHSMKKHSNLLELEKRILGMANVSPRNVWWVNQSRTMEKEKDGGFLWAPLKNKLGKDVYHWSTLENVQKDDIILHYANGSLRYVSKALSGSQKTKKPTSLSGTDWDKDGRLVKVEYHVLGPIQLGTFAQEIAALKISKGPIDKSAGVKEGYLFYFSEKALQEIQRLCPDIQWPDFVPSRTGGDSIKPAEIDFGTQFSIKALHFESNQEKAIIRQTSVALKNGKHVILIGPPGTGKSKLAKEVCETYRGKDNYIMATASSDWSTYETIGGYRPGKDANLKFYPGIFLNCFRDESTDEQCNKWLIIDEINRADIDKSFGALFSALTGDSVVLPSIEIDRKKVRIIGRQEDNTQIQEEDFVNFVIPSQWRIIATMNTSDKSALYEMSYAFMRRFAFIPIEVPSDINKDLIYDYINKWENVRINDDICSNVAKLWLEINKYPERKIGPAIIEDICRYLAETDPADYAGAIIMYVLPQLEGIPEKDATTLFTAIHGLKLIDRSEDKELLIQFASEFLGISKGKLGQREE